MYSTRLSAIVAMALLTAVAAACGGSAAPPAGAKASYSIGISTDLSAQFSAVAGIPCAEGFQAYIAGRNQQGGINGHKIRLDVMDDRSDVQVGLANYQKALNSEDLAFVLNAASAIVAPVGAKAINDHIIETSLGGYMGGVGVYQYTYSINPSINNYLATLTAFAATKVSSTSGAKMALIQYDSPSVRSNTPTVEKAFKDKGWSVVYSQLVPQSTLDFSVAAGQIAVAKPDVIVTNLLESQLGQFITAARSRQVMAPAVNYNSNIADSAFGKINDPGLFLLRFTASAIDKSNPGVVAMRTQAAETGHTQGMDNSYFPLCYVHGQVIAQAIEKCGDACTRETLNKALEQTSVDPQGLMAGKPGFSPTDHIMPKGMAVVSWDNAKSLPVTVPNFGFK
jgi:ABC-type branched-subunit amino acid transport system substrate-binding protein